jgi:predicted house-cleaning noncanonical NTP pyrophosphatase (MazG superfamily)
MKVYNKLIRDKIPHIIEESGFEATIRILDDEEYKVELKKKLLEEVKELLEAEEREDFLEELADVFEVLDYILITEKIDLFDIQEYRVKKNMKKGGFEDKVFLENVK